MNTPAHLIFGLAGFGRPGRPRVSTAALCGALAPDLSLYLMVSWSIYVKGVPPRTVFREYYYSDEWQQVFAVDNSFVLWGLLLAIAIWRRWPALLAFAGAGLLHLAFDFPLHNHDARMHFWPLSRWVFESPLSYWDNSRYAGVIGPLELGMSMLLCLFLLFRFRSLGSWALILCLGGMEILASGFFGWFFS